MAPTNSPDDSDRVLGWLVLHSTRHEPATSSKVHVLKAGIICDTDSRGYPTPRNLSPAEIVLDATEGFIPLWAKDTTLRWRFQERSFAEYQEPEKLKAAVRQLMGEALLAWGDACPVTFVYREDAWDFEVVIRPSDSCTIHGCVLASAFFPDSGRHELRVYPKMFTQSPEEQVQTMIHELGHVFGLRHFFADVSEKAWSSVIFGEHVPFTIMNYGQLSELTEADRNDLKRLYQLVWAGKLTQVNGTPIRLVQPFHSNR